MGQWSRIRGKFSFWQGEILRTAYRNIYTGCTQIATQCKNLFATKYTKVDATKSDFSHHRWRGLVHIAGQMEAIMLVSNI